MNLTGKIGFRIGITGKVIIIVQELTYRGGSLQRDTFWRDATAKDMAELGVSTLIKS